MDSSNISDAKGRRSSTRERAISVKELELEICKASFQKNNDDSTIDVIQENSKEVNLEITNNNIDDSDLQNYSKETSISNLVSVSSNKNELEEENDNQEYTNEQNDDYEQEYDDDEDTELIYQYREGNRSRTIVGGTVIGLVDYLTLSDSAFMNSFFVTYRSFMTPPELFDELIERYYLCNDSVTKKYMALRRWLSLLIGKTITYKMKIFDVFKDKKYLVKLIAKLLRSDDIYESYRYSSFEEQIEAFKYYWNEYDYEKISTVLNYDLLNDYTEKTLHSVLLEMAEFHVKYQNILGSDEQAIIDEYIKEEATDIVNVIHLWITRYFYDFRDDAGSTALKKILEFSENEKNKHREDLNTTFTKICEAIRLSDFNYKKFTRKERYEHLAQKNIKRMNLQNYSFSFFAEQMTIIDTDLFIQLNLFECMKVGWTKKDKEKRAPTITSMIARFNLVSSFVTTQILMAMGTKNRVSLISYFIDVISVLVEVHNNYSSGKAVISALQIQPIYRLRKTWSLVPKEQMEKYEKYKEIFSELENGKQLREELTKKFSDPCVPYLGLYLTDLTMMDAANPDDLGDGIINFEKCRKIFQTMYSLTIFQATTEKQEQLLSPDATFRWWLNNFKSWDNEYCYKESMKIEPTPKMIKQEELKEETKVLCASKHKKPNEGYAAIFVKAEVYEDVFFVHVNHTALDLLKALEDMQFIACYLKVSLCLITNDNEIPVDESTVILFMCHNNSHQCDGAFTFSVQARYGMISVSSDQTSIKSFFVNSKTTCKEIILNMVSKMYPEREPGSSSLDSFSLCIIYNKKLKRLKLQQFICTFLINGILTLYFDDMAFPKKEKEIITKIKEMNDVDQEFDGRKNLKRKTNPGCCDSVDQIVYLLSTTPVLNTVGELKKKHEHIIKGLMFLAPPLYKIAVNMDVIPEGYPDPPPFHLED